MDSRVYSLSGLQLSTALVNVFHNLKRRIYEQQQNMFCIDFEYFQPALK